MRILTEQEALSSGMTPSQIRTVARSLQRIASRGYDSRDFNEDSVTHPREIRKNAALLFKLARTM